MLQNIAILQYNTKLSQVHSSTKPPLKEIRFYSKLHNIGGKLASNFDAR